MKGNPEGEEGCGRAMNPQVVLDIDIKRLKPAGQICLLNPIQQHLPLFDAFRLVYTFTNYGKLESLGKHSILGCRP